MYFVVLTKPYEWIWPGPWILIAPHVEKVAWFLWLGTKSPNLDPAFTRIHPGEDISYYVISAHITKKQVSVTSIHLFRFLAPIRCSGGSSVLSSWGEPSKDPHSPTQLTWLIFTKGRGTWQGEPYPTQTKLTLTDWPILNTEQHMLCHHFHSVHWLIFP